MGDDGQPNVQGVPEQNGPQNGQQTDQQKEGAPLEGALDDETLAALKADADELRREAEARQQAVEAQRKAIEEQLAKMNQIAYGPAYDERSRQMNLEDEKKELDRMNQTLSRLELAAEDAAYWSREFAASYQQAWDAAHGIKPQVEQDSEGTQELPDMGDLQKAEDKRNAGIMSEHELEELKRAAEDKQKEADGLRDDIREAQQKTVELDAQAHKIVDRLGYYTDERMRKLELGDVNDLLAQTDQRILDLTRQAEEAGRQAQELRLEYEESKRRAEQYDQLQDEDFPDMEVDPLDPYAHDPLAKELAEQETLTREAYELAKGQIIWIATVTDLQQKKPPEERKQDDIPPDVLQSGLDLWRQKLPGLKCAMEKAQKEVLEHREDLKKNYIRREMTDTVREQLDEIMKLNRNQDDPDDNGPKPVTGLSVHAGRLGAANENRHSSQQWREMHEALSNLKLTDQLRDLQRCHAMGELDYGGEQINSLRSRIDLAAERTQQYVDYKSGTFLVKLGIGRGPEYLREAQEALKYLRDIQVCIQTMDQDYTVAVSGANERYEPKAAAAQNDPKPQPTDASPRPSLNRNAANTKSKSNAGPHIG